MMTDDNFPERPEGLVIFACALRDDLTRHRVSVGDPDMPKKSNAERQADHRRRLRYGLTVLSVEVDLFAVTDRLIRLGRLTENDAVDENLIVTALEAEIVRWCKKP